MFLPPYGQPCPLPPLCRAPGTEGKGRRIRLWRCARSCTVRFLFLRSHSQGKRAPHRWLWRPSTDCVMRSCASICRRVKPHYRNYRGAFGWRMRTFPVLCTSSYCTDPPAPAMQHGGLPPEDDQSGYMVKRALQAGHLCPCSNGCLRDVRICDIPGLTPIFSAVCCLVPQK